MDKFTIDFFELAFLAESCIPPRPIARAHFWQNLTDRYWKEMTEGQRRHLFNWLSENWQYKSSLYKEMDTKIFHARFDPENQYMIETSDGQRIRAFLLGEKYHTQTNTYIDPEQIRGVEKFTPEFEY